MRKLMAVAIDWDKDDNKDIKLPETMEIPEGMVNEEKISDYLSEQTGYCHKGFALTCI